MNKAIIIGNLTRDPEKKVTPDGVSVTNFTVAVSRNGNREKADFLPVVTWRTLADNCAKYLAKGRKVAVIGEIQTRSYTTNDGSKRHVTEIIANEVEFISAPMSGSKPSEASDEEFIPDDFKTPEKAAEGVTRAGFEEATLLLDEEDLPF